jgi:hypothetical protein
MKLVILDGYHAGRVTEALFPPDSFASKRPPAQSKEEFWASNTTADSTEGAEEVLEYYKLTFTSVDRQVALYTTSGKSLDFVEQPAILKLYTENPNSDPEVIEEEKTCRQEHTEEKRPVDRKALDQWIEGGKKLGVDLGDGFMGAPDE